MTAAWSAGASVVTARRPVAALTSTSVMPGSCSTSERTAVSQCPQLIPVTVYSVVAIAEPYTPRGYMPTDGRFSSPTRTDSPFRERKIYKIRDNPLTERDSGGGSGRRVRTAGQDGW